MKKYYLLINNKEEGPYSLIKLGLKNITPNTLIRYQDQTDYVEAKKIKELEGWLPNKSSHNDTQDQSNLKIESEQVPIMIDRQFNRFHPKYRWIKITNVCLFIIFCFMEMSIRTSQGITFNPIPSLITFWIARTIIRNIFKQNPNFNYKIPITIIVYLGSWIAKSILIGLILRFVF